MSKRRTRLLSTTLVAISAAVGVGMVTAGVMDTPALSRGSASISEPLHTPPAALGERIPATVIRVVDGDTVHVRTATAPDLDVRIVGIDTPENVGNRPKGCGGVQASEWAKRSMPEGAPVTLVVDPKVRSSVRGAIPQVDRYGRTLAYVELFGGTNFSLDAVRRGYGRFADYGTPLTIQGAFLDAQGAANAEGAGINGTFKGPDEALCTPATSYPPR